MRPWPYPRVLAHRGGGALAPENTIAAIRVGCERGFRGVEFDAMLCGDGEAVLIHDPTLDRTTNGTGPVAARSSAELAALDAGRWFSRDFAGEPVPRLAEAIAYCRAQRVWINAEIKPSPGTDAATGRQVAHAVAQGFADLAPAAGSAAGPDPQAPLLSSFSAEALAAAREAVPWLARGLLCGRMPPDWREQLQRLGCVALHCDHRWLDPAGAARVHRAGYWLFCYTVNDRKRAVELARWGVDAICTDRLDRIEAALLD
jgi:glycerophosphoryl diester phosphodiesterase